MLVINEDIGVELEKKFLISESTKLKLIKDAKSNKMTISKKRIEQNYLFKENSSVFFNVATKEWVVSLNVNNSKELLQFKEEKNTNKAVTLFTPYKGVDLLTLKSAARIRILDGEAIFTFKLPVEGGKGDHEFEGSIQKYVANSSFFNYFIKNDKYKVKKYRTTINKDGLVYEIDDFDDVDLSKQNNYIDLSTFNNEKLYLLEIEFDTLEEYQDFIPDFVHLNVTDVKGFGNKKMAKMIGKKATS